jgi:YesN/AraC family two-component response regulator
VGLVDSASVITTSAPDSAPKGAAETDVRPRTRILFVDDEAQILTGLRNLFRKDRQRWDMVFALGGRRGLDAVREQRFDVVVSDMQMPEVDGAMLLTTIKEESPSTVRIMLSGFADDESLVRARPALHQLLLKPIDVATLRKAIEHSIDAFVGTPAGRD